MKNESHDFFSDDLLPVIEIPRVPSETYEFKVITSFTVVYSFNGQGGRTVVVFFLRFLYGHPFGTCETSRSD